MANPPVDLVPFGHWTLRDEAAQRRSPARRARAQMIAEVQRDLFLASPETYASHHCLAVAAVASDNLNETELLAGWALLKSHLSGSGARSGYRAFIALLQDSEIELSAALNKIAAQSATHKSWYLVAAPVNTPPDALAVIQQVEWRANKHAQSAETPSLTYLGTTGAL